MVSSRPWLYPAEIFPLNVRTKGNAWGVVGWSIGNGWLTLLCPVMFDAVSEYTLFIFAACNVITLPMVYCLYPEVRLPFFSYVDYMPSSLMMTPGHTPLIASTHLHLTNHLLHIPSSLHNHLLQTLSSASLTTLPRQTNAPWKK